MAQVTEVRRPRRRGAGSGRQGTPPSLARVNARLPTRSSPGRSANMGRTPMPLIPRAVHKTPRRPWRPTVVTVPAIHSASGCFSGCASLGALLWIRFSGCASLMRSSEALQRRAEERRPVMHAQVARDARQCHATARARSCRLTVNCAHLPLRPQASPDRKAVGGPVPAYMLTERSRATPPEAAGWVGPATASALPPYRRW